MKAVLKNINIISLAFIILLCTQIIRPINAEAASVYHNSDNYSSINVDKSGNCITIVLTCTNGPCYAQISIYGYSSTGAYIDHATAEGILQTNESITLTFNTNAAHYVIYASVYPYPVPYGTPICTWNITL